MGSHAAVAAEFLGDWDLVKAVLADYKTAPLSEQEKALFAFLEKVLKATAQINQGDIDIAKASGWTDEALYDAIMVCGLFKFFNTWTDGTGVHNMPAFAYEMSAKMLVSEGYAGGGPQGAEGP